MKKGFILIAALVAIASFSFAWMPDSTRITYRIPARVKVNNAFPAVVVPADPSRRSVMIDSLQNTMMLLFAKKDSLLTITRQQASQQQAMQAQLIRLSEENKNLNKELDNANVDRLQSSHTSSVLYIFSVLIVIMVLVALVWMMSKKKIREPEKVVVANGYSRNGTIEVTAAVPAFDHRLERIEKLGNLREKGLLTEDEFNSQKKQILAERG